MTIHVTVNKDNNNKTKVPDDVFVVFPSFVFLLNWMSKLIHNICTSKLIIKNMAAYVQAHKQLCLCFYVSIHYFVVLDIPH